MAEVDLLTRYYLDQAGSGSSAFYSGPIYQRGSGSLQRGAGIGSFLGGLFRRILPVVKRGVTAAGREVINSGAHFLNDLNKNVSPCVALKNRSREVVDNLTKKVMSGEGYKKRSASRKRQSTGGIQTSKLKRKRSNDKKKATAITKKVAVKKTPKKKTRDIFST